MGRGELKQRREVLQCGFEAWESIRRSGVQLTREAEQGTGKGDQGPEPELHVRRDIKYMSYRPDKRALGNRMGRVGRIEAVP